MIFLTLLSDISKLINVNHLNFVPSCTRCREYYALTFLIAVVADAAVPTAQATRITTGDTILAVIILLFHTMMSIALEALLGDWASVFVFRSPRSDFVLLPRDQQVVQQDLVSIQVLAIIFCSFHVSVRIINRFNVIQLTMMDILSWM